MPNPITLEIKGIEELERRLKGLSRALQGEAISRALYAGALVVEGYAKTLVPVDTGFLRSSIQSAHGPDNSAIVAVAAEYAAYVEYGTSRMHAQPYLRPAVDEHISEIEQAVGETLERELSVGGL